MKKRLYQLIKAFYWIMPPQARKYLNGFRYTLVRKFKYKLLASPGLHSSDGVSVDEFINLIHQFSDIYVFELSVDWDIALYQRPQHLATALGLDDSLVIYKTQGDNVKGFRQAEKNVWLTNEFDYVDSLSGVKRIYFSTTLFNDQKHMMDMRTKGKVIYEYIDHISEEISGGKKEIVHLNRIKSFAFNGGVDHIVVTAGELYKEACQSIDHHKVTLVPNGVNFKHYQHRSNKSLDNAAIEKFVSKYDTVVGYFGAIAPWLWYDLIREVVNINPDIGFLMIGPDYGGCQTQLPRSDNFLWIGPVSYHDLPKYASHFDVCWIPFRPGEIARTTSPLKLFEYFAMGKPVSVTSDMLECVKYSEVYHGKDVKEFNKSLLSSFDSVHDEEYIKKLKALASNNSWKRRAATYKKINYT